MALLRSLAQRIKVSRLLYFQMFAVLLAFSLMVAVSYVYTSRIVRSELHESALNAITVAQTQIDAALSEAELAVDAMAYLVKQIIMTGGTAEDVRSGLRLYKENVLEYHDYLELEHAYGYFDVFDGLYIDASDHQPDTNYPERQEWYNAAIAAGGRTIMVPFSIGIGAKNNSIIFANQITDEDGNQLAVVAMTINSEKIMEYATSIRLTEGGYGVLTVDGIVYAHPHEPYIGRPTSDIVPETGERMANGEDFFDNEIKSYTGEISTMYHKRLDNGWYLGLITPNREYFSVTYDMMIFLGILGVLMTTLLCIALYRIFAARKLAEESARLMFEGSPIGMHIWRPDLTMINCNMELANMLGAKSKDGLINDFFSFSPDVQPDGQISYDKAFEALRKAFEDGRVEFSWTHKNADGELIPCDVSLAVGKHRGEDIAVGFTRDLRKEIELQRKIRQADRELFEAEAANKAKSDFLAHMSHEIRTPMNAILGITELQLHKDTLPDETVKALEHVYESGNMLLGIINDILDLAKIEAGKMEVIQDRYDIPSLVNDVVQLNRLRNENEDIIFIVDVDENTPLGVLGDEIRIKQVLNNILSNAFKYTKKGEIKLSVRSQPVSKDGFAKIVFSVSDTGQGMSREQVDSLFDDYTRFNVEANRTTVGTGLGMSITKRLIEMMDGEVNVESREGIGTTFTVGITQQLVGSDVCGPELARKLREFDYHTITLARTAYITREYMPYGRVLIVDDVQSNLYVTKGMLIPYGLQIDTALSGPEAIEKIENGSTYDIIFMDYMMPKMDGMETMKILRDMGYKGSIVALTANAIVGQAEKFLSSGFDGYISKPIDTRELNEALNEFVKRSENNTDTVPPASGNEASGGFLVVDDVSINIYIVREMLLQYNLPVDTASSGAEAVELVEQGKVYDIIFMDHMMPDMNGAEATEKIRATGYTGCIVALTAHSPDDVGKLHAESGFNGYLGKPINSSELDKLVKEYVHNLTSPDAAVMVNVSKLSEIEEYFIEDAESAISTLEELYAQSRAFTAEDMETYEITVHGMKSALRNIGKMELGEEAYKLELAAKGGDTAMMETETPVFVKKLEKLVEDMKTNS